MAFVEKEKNPKLSAQLQEVIERSHGEQNGNGLDEIARYKHKVMTELTSNIDILSTLHNNDLESKLNWEHPNGDMYRNVNIFDYMKLPSLKDEIENYICFEVSTLASYSNDFTNVNVVFRTVSHVNDMRTDWGIQRHDLLALIIKNQFDWTKVFGKTLHKVSDVGKIGEDDFYYREIVYQCDLPNNHYNKLNR
jgi:hypothetical protein